MSETAASTRSLSGPVRAAGGERLPGAAALQSISLDANVSTAAASLRFNDLSFQVNDATGSGVMDLSYGATGKPKISSTVFSNELCV